MHRTDESMRPRAKSLFFLIVFLSCCLLLFCGGARAGAGRPLDLGSAPIVLGARASSQERFAARELQRYLYQLTGHVRRIVATGAGGPSGAGGAGAPEIVLGTPESNPLIRRVADRLTLSESAVGAEGYRLKVVRVGRTGLLAVAARTPIGVLYGVYGLLERLGFGFYLGGDTRPPRGTSASVPGELDEAHKPVFAIRGSLPWFNFLDSPTTWDLDDYKQFFAQMVKQKYNFVGFHTYDSEPFAPCPWKGDVASAEPLASSLTYGWGTVRGLRTTDFGFGTGDYFDRDPFVSEGDRTGAPRRVRILKARALLARALQIAHGLGLKTCVGFELNGDPTDPETLARLEARIKALTLAYPMVDYVWFWQSEALGLGSERPAGDSRLGQLIEHDGDAFRYLGDPKRIAEAVRVSRFANAAYRILKGFSPKTGVIISGWGGDKWLHFSDFFKGLDRTLPGDVIFSALDNIDPTSEPNVARAYADLPPGRHRWPIPWWESDGGYTRGDQWAPQCNTRPFVPICRDALAKGCDGMLAIHWRTRDVEEAAGFQARFAWDPSLTYEQYYDDFARRCYGRRWAAEMSAVHRDLEALGARWTGALGQAECAAFGWYVGGRLPDEPHLSALRAVRSRVARVRSRMSAAGRTEGLERIDWLLTTIDWVLRYDAAGVRLRPGGDLAEQVAAVERAGADGDSAVTAKAVRAYAGLMHSGLREALQTYPRKMSSMGEFGTLATINVKAYAAWLELVERLRRVDPALPPVKPEPAVGADEPPVIVLRSPPSFASPGMPLRVEAAIVSGRPIRSAVLHYRRPGDAAWRATPMRLCFRKTYAASVPGAAVTSIGLELYVEVEDTGGRRRRAPDGYPAVTWSVTGMLPEVRSPERAVPARLPAAPTRLTVRSLGGYETVVSWEELPEDRGCRYEVYRTAGKAPTGYMLNVATTYAPPVYDLVDAANSAFTYRVVAVSPDGSGASLWASASVSIPPQPAPDPATGLRVLPGGGSARLWWLSPGPAARVVRIYRTEGDQANFVQVGERPAAGTPTFLDAGLRVGATYRYRLTVVDLGGQASAPCPPVGVQPGPVLQIPVFAAPLGSDVRATLQPGDRRADGAREAPAAFARQGGLGALDLRAGGHVTFAYDPAFDMADALTIRCRVRLDSIEQMPVIASCGAWDQNGWFLQTFGGGFRFYLGGRNVLDAGRAEVGRWTDLVAVYDGAEMRLYLDGHEVGSRAVTAVDDRPWGGPLVIGQYSAVQGDYQMRGLVRDFALYHRALTTEEIAAEYAKHGSD